MIIGFLCLKSSGFLDFVGLYGTVKWCPGAESNHRHGDFQLGLNFYYYSIKSAAYGVCSKTK